MRAATTFSSRRRSSNPASTFRQRTRSSSIAPICSAWRSSIKFAARIGRSKTRAYAYLTVPPRRQLTGTAEKRLNVLQTLDTLGAGFNLASHDLDIRGAGNLLGEEQSGHIREVGIELYQEMLEEAIASLRSGDETIALDDQWSPQINLGMAVLIPESYVADLDVRLGLYRRLADSAETESIEGLAAELIDRFGPLPEEVENLLELVTIKRLCGARKSIASTPDRRA